MTWVANINESVIYYLEGLKRDKGLFQFNPVNKSLIEESNHLSLGFSCYALKLNKLFDTVDSYSDKEITNWINYINSYQNTSDIFPMNSFVDENYVKILEKNKKMSKISNIAKATSNNLFNTNFKSIDLKLSEYIQAETKQSIATLYELDNRNSERFLDFPDQREEIKSYLDTLNWNFPWSSGAQFAGISLFTKTQLNNEEYKNSRESLINFLNEIVKKEDGFYYKGNTPKKQELINGAMKIISGLDWLDEKIHYPDKIIDYCLDNKPNNEGCDVVDLVYVIYKCAQQTTYKRKEVNKYLSDILEIIYLHFRKDEGGFSYFLNSCQTNYYDVKFSNGYDEADIHGTILFSWAVVMILDILELDYFKYNILKP
ncbi:MAG: hypothetical protein CBD76_00400 [Pelagibacteraceae bacterium TMED216]|nr:MAG: hypothetical protein CBD76_00400 [Pelagibacteraceae bacterium TMED216]|tara:strand:+ start:16 stop:1131 length:1116 start_codon:yes stop_codon:yes gene_type:complete